MPETKEQPLTVIVIGGGIAGTAAARELSKSGYNVIILEKSDRLGGRIRSINTGAYTFEMGAGFVTDSYANTFELLRNASLDQKLIRRTNTSAIAKDGSLNTVSLREVAFSRKLLTWRAKTRFLAEAIKIVAAWRNLDQLDLVARYDTKSLNEVFSDSAGRELLDYIVQPALGGYFYWSAGVISQGMLMWLIRVAVSEREIYVLREGLQRLPEFAAQGSTVRLSHEVRSVKQIGRRFQITAVGPLGSKNFEVDGVVCATTASVVPKIVVSLTTDQKKFFTEINYSSTVVLARIYSGRVSETNWSIGYPRVGGTILDAATIINDMDRTGAPAGLVKLYASGARAGEMCDWDDTKVRTEMVSRENVVDALVQTGAPASEYVQRWPEALPIFEVGHLGRLKDFASGKVEGDAPLVFAGDYIGGPFIEGALTSGIKAAKRLQMQLMGEHLDRPST